MQSQVVDRNEACCVGGNRTELLSFLGKVILNNDQQLLLPMRTARLFLTYLVYYLLDSDSSSRYDVIERCEKRKALHVKGGLLDNIEYLTALYSTSNRC